LKSVSSEIAQADIDAVRLVKREGRDAPTAAMYWSVTMGSPSLLSRCRGLLGEFGGENEIFFVRVQRL